MNREIEWGNDDTGCEFYTIAACNTFSMPELGH